MATPDIIIPKTQLAAVLYEEYGKRHTIEKSYPVPSPGSGEVLIRIEATSLCAGDVNPREGFPPAPKEPKRPIVLGHEGVGKVVALGAGAEGSGFAVGDRVGMGWRSSVCTSCKHCKAGRDNWCQSVKSNGYDNSGTFQEYVALPTSSLVIIPDLDLPAETIAPLLCAGGTALGSVRTATADLAPNDWVCITGAAGGVGSLATQYVKNLGFRVVAVDASSKEAICTAAGADAFASFEDADAMVKHIKQVTEGGAHAAVICTANPASYSQALEYLAVGGILVSVGPAMLHMHSGHLMLKAITIKAQPNGSKKDIADALLLAKKGIVPKVEIIELDQIDAALDQIQRGKSTGRQALLFSRS